MNIIIKCNFTISKTTAFYTIISHTVVIKSAFTWCKFWCTFQNQAYKKLYPEKIFYTFWIKVLLYFGMDDDLVYLASFAFLHPRYGCFFSLPSELSKPKRNIKSHRNFLNMFVILDHSPSWILRRKTHAFPKKNFSKQK